MGRPKGMTKQQIIERIQCDLEVNDNEMQEMVRVNENGILDMTEAIQNRIGRDYAYRDLLLKINK